MCFEELRLRPASGVVNEAAVAAWLDARRHGFRDPVGGDGWHLSATPRTAADLRRARLENPTRFLVGVRVLVFADQVVVAAIADLDDLARALEFVSWLVSTGDWTVQVDRNPAEPVGDPRRLFPASTPDPSTLGDDATVSPLTEGTLLTWTDDTRPGREFVAHTSGVWRLRSDSGGWFGGFTDAATAVFRAAIDALDADDPELAQDDSSAPVRLELESLQGIEYIHLDPGSPPASCRPLVVLVCAWLHALEDGTGDGPPEGLANVRAAR